MNTKLRITGVGIITQLWIRFTDFREYQTGDRETRTMTDMSKPLNYLSTVNE